ncbi:MAG TPA: redoxin domain-containing protein [Pyrinomonadaceae bacterium]|jgi:peroxiredoxin|nr:redoxin domain-containing protein [Pyrinomonadaceae bacterium]
MLTTQSGRLTIFLVLVAVAVSFSLLGSPRTSAQDADFEDELEHGRLLFRQRKYDDALKSFKRANEMRDKKCGQCYGWMSETYLALEAYKNVIDSADKMIEFAGGDNQLLLKAYNNKGLALQASAEKKDQKKLAAAEAVFRQGLAITGVSPVLHYNLGVVLMQLNRDPEGIAEIKEYLKSQPRGGFSDMARKLAENPRRARENYAPDFAFTSQQGEYIALEDLKGKVVVLDFWGTWCPPCVESVPELRNLHKRYSKEPSFVLIGISSDGDEQAWREFTEKNRMVWPQYRDKDRKILSAFNIRAFPTYIIIDHEGIVRFQSVGFSWLRSANLDDAIKKYVKVVARSQEAR